MLIQEHDKHPDNLYMFLSPKTGGMWFPDSVVNLHRKILKDAGLEHLRFHDLSGIGTQRKYADNAGTGADLNRYLLKSESTDNGDSKWKELRELLSKTNARYLANFKVDSRIPYSMRHGFDRDMEIFSQNLSGHISDTYAKATGKGGITSKSLVEVSPQRI